MAKKEPVITYKAANGETVRLVQGVALINTKHPSGTPALVTIIEPDQKIDLAGGEEFLIFWADEKMIRPNLFR